MLITSTSIMGGSQLAKLYKDSSSLTDCTVYKTSGTDVCSDIITIELPGNYLVRYMKISTDDYLMLCEVEVFAGNNF